MEINKNNNLIDIKEQELLNTFQMVKGQYEEHFTIYQSFVNSKISSMEKTLSIVHKTAKSGKESLKNLKDNEQKLKLINKEFNKVKNNFKEIKKSIYFNEFKLNEIEDKFNIKYGQYIEAKKNNKKRALKLLKDMLLLDIEYNKNRIEQIKLQASFQEKKEVLDSIKKVKYGLKNKKFSIFEDLNKRLYLQDILSFKENKKDNLIDVDIIEYN